jgi:hypothetical protein
MLEAMTQEADECVVEFHDPQVIMVAQQPNQLRGRGARAGTYFKDHPRAAVCLGNVPA